MAVVVVAAVWALVRTWGDTRQALETAQRGWVAVALLLGMLNVLCTALAWRAALAALGSRLAVRPALAVFSVGQLGKYLPGSVWPLLVQAQLTAQRGVPRSRVVVAGLLALAEGMATALAIGLVVVPAWASAEGATGALLVALVVTAVVVAVAGLVAGTSPQVVGLGVGLLLRVTRRPPLDRTPDRRALLAVLAGSGAAGLSQAAHAAALAAGLGLGGRAVAAAAGGLVLATAVGLLAVPVPAGLGVREAVLVAVVAPVASVQAAVTIAVLSRLLLVVCDLASALGGWLVARRADGLGPVL